MKRKLEVVLGKLESLLIGAMILAGGAAILLAFVTFIFFISLWWLPHLEKWFGK